MTADDARDPIDAITAALARLRGRRGPRPPWDGQGPFGPGGPGGPGGAAGVGGPGRPHGDGHGGPHGRGHGARGPAWGEAMAARFAGAARFRLLEALAAASAPLSVSDIAEAIGVDQPRASRLVQQAADMGHVRREADPDDARRTRVVLTAEGLALVRGFRGERRASVETALASFSDEERAQLAVLLAKLADAWPRG